MTKFLRLLEQLDYMRMVIGILILVDGYPLIFFFRETLRLAPGSSAFTAIAFIGGLLLMTPFTVLRRLYRFNTTMMYLGLGFLLLSIFYMIAYNGVPGFNETDRDLMYYAFIFIFLFLLLNIPNDIIPVVIPTIVFFTLFSNLGLIYSLITDPTWAIGQRATISLNMANTEAGSGNPHVFARNAYMGVIAGAIWIFRPTTSILFRLLSLFSGLLSIAVLVLTQTRSSALALLLAFILFMYFNVRPAQIRTAVRGLLRPIPIAIMVTGFVAISFFIQRFENVYGVLYGYLLNFIERNLENLYALFDLKAQGTDFRATLDDSAANRQTSANFFRNAILGEPYKLIFGYGYKFLYLDVPILETIVTEGLPGLALFGGLVAMSGYYTFRIMQHSTNTLSTFLAYFFPLILITVFTGGRPNDISFWFPFALMIRFFGVDHLFPPYLLDEPTHQTTTTLRVVPEASV